jgi:hypothetical protein
VQDVGGLCGWTCMPAHLRAFSLTPQRPLLPLHPHPLALPSRPAVLLPASPPHSTPRLPTCPLSATVYLVIQQPGRSVTTTSIASRPFQAGTLVETGLARSRAKSRGSPSHVAWVMQRAIETLGNGLAGASITGPLWAACELTRCKPTPHNRCATRLEPGGYVKINLGN